MGGLLALGIAALGLVAALAGNLAGRWEGATVAKLSPEALAGLLRPFYRVTVPPGAGPFPTALLLSGCDGPHDNLFRWAELFAAEGWASVVVDSHTPRGFQKFGIWRLVCTGQLLMGAERAGDVLVALDDVRRMPFVDPARLVLVGSSHGGWTIMDLFALDPPARLPFNLSALPGDPAADPLRGVVGSILVYPWCGLGNRARGAGWRHPAPVLFILSGRDSIAPAADCDGIVAALRQRGVPVETVLFASADHAFDQDDHPAPTWLRFDAATTAAALAAAATFLRGLPQHPT